jgi:hypothetical protein
VVLLVSKSEVEWNELRTVPATESFHVIECRNCAWLVPADGKETNDNEDIGTPDRLHSLARSPRQSEGADHR